MPEDIAKKIEKKVEKKHKLKRRHIPGKEREYFTTNLAALLKAGVPVGSAFESMSHGHQSRVFKKTLADMNFAIDDGTPLWQVLEQSGAIADESLALVRLGEESGKLVENLEIAAKQEGKQRVFRSKVRSALLYPSFVLTLTMIVGLGIAWFLLPRLSETFDELNVKLPAISRVFIGFGAFLKVNGAWAIPAFLAGSGLLIYLIFFAPKLKVIGQHILLRFPGISRLIKEIEIARFGYLLGTMLSTGLTISQALKLLEQATNSVHYKKLYKHLEESIDDGFGLSTGMASYKKSARFFPSTVQQMITAGEKSGSLPETLQNIGTSYEQKADASAENLQVMLEPILLVIVWLGVLGVAIAVIMPIYGLLSGLE